MPWPPSNPSTGYQMAGVTTVQWGTDALFNSWIVESLTSTDVIETIYIEQGTGLRAVRIQLFQGREIDLTIVADSRFVHPTAGTTVTVVDPLSGVTLSGKVVANSFNAARKVEGKRVIRIVIDTLIEGVP